MTTNVRLDKRRRGRLNLSVGVPNWLPLVDCVTGESEGFTFTQFRVETELNNSNFTWGPFRVIKSKVAISTPICSVSGDALVVELWAKAPIEPNTIEVCIIPNS